MNGQVTLRPITPGNGWPPRAQTKASQFAQSSCSLPISCLSPSISVTAGRRPGRELESSCVMT